MSAMNRAAALSFFAVLSAATAEPASHRPLPTRSLYVRVNFRLCEHMTHAVISENGQRAGTLPARRTFQFTYYPELERMAPEVVQIRVEGVYADNGEPFLARLAATPSGLHTARDHVRLDVSKDLERFRSRLDVRHEPIDFLIHCDRFCSRKNAAVASSLDRTSTAPPSPARSRSHPTAASSRSSRARRAPSSATVAVDFSAGSSRER